MCFSQLPSDCIGSVFNSILLTISESRFIILLSSSLSDDISNNSSSIKHSYNYIIVHGYFNKIIPFPIKGKMFSIGTSVSPSPLVSYLTTQVPSLLEVPCVTSRTTALAQSSPSHGFANTKLPIFKL